MKLGSVKSRVRNMAGDISALQFTDVELVDWINDGIRECALSNNLLQKRGTQPTELGKDSYELPDDILKMHSVMFDNVKLDVLTLEEFDKYVPGVGTNDSNQSRGGPVCCYIWANSLTLFPAPNRVAPLIINYIYQPDQLEKDDDTVELPLPVSYHSRIVDYCLAMVAQQDDDMERYNLKITEFKTGVQDLRSDQYVQDVYPSITVSPRDM